MTSAHHQSKTSAGNPHAHASSAPSPRVPRIPRERIGDARLRGVIERAQRLSTPKPEWYETLAHSPEMAVAYARYWDLTHRGGTVAHTTKELMRIVISELLGCGFCADQRSALAIEEGLQEREAAACALPDFDHPDARVRAALRFARAITLDRPGNEQDWDVVYEELCAVYSLAEIVELGCFAAIAVGGVKFSRSLNEPGREGETDG